MVGPGPEEHSVLWNQKIGRSWNNGRSWTGRTVGPVEPYYRSVLGVGRRVGPVGSMTRSVLLERCPPNTYTTRKLKSRALQQAKKHANRILG